MQCNKFYFYFNLSRITKIVPFGFSFPSGFIFLTSIESQVEFVCRCQRSGTSAL